MKGELISKRGIVLSLFALLIIGVIITNNVNFGVVETELRGLNISEEETENGKIITISAPDELNYENVLGHTELSEEASAEKIHLYHLVGGDKKEIEIEKYDKNNNGLIDYIEWNVPHLSEQTYELIVEITTAEHLNEDKEFILDIYNEVYKLDDVWSEPIPDKHCVRITFEQKLDSSRDITIYPRIIKGNPKIEVYEVGGTEIIAEFNNIISNQYNKVLLTNLQGSQDSFDLRIVDGSLEFDHIIDPVEGLAPIVHLNTELNLVDLDSTQVAAITNDDSDNVIIGKGLVLTTEMDELAGTIDTLTDANCSLIYYTAAGYPADSITFEVYDSFGGNQLDISTLPVSGSDSLVHLVDLETKGLAASEVSTMVVYVTNTIGTKGYDLYVDKIVCTIDYTESASTCTPPVDGDWAVTCSDNCLWDSLVTVPDNVSMTGTGKLILTATMDFTNTHWELHKEDGCEFVMGAGGKLE